MKGDQALSGFTLRLCPHSRCLSALGTRWLIAKYGVKFRVCPLFSPIVNRLLMFCLFLRAKPVTVRVIYPRALSDSATSGYFGPYPALSARFQFLLTLVSPRFLRCKCLSGLFFI